MEPQTPGVTGRIRVQSESHTDLNTDALLVNSSVLQNGLQHNLGILLNVSGLTTFLTRVSDKMGVACPWALTGLSLLRGYWTTLKQIRYSRSEGPEELTAHLMALSPCGRFVAVALRNQFVKVFKLDDAVNLFSLKDPAAKHLHDLCWANDGHLILTTDFLAISWQIDLFKLNSCAGTSPFSKQKISLPMRYPQMTTSVFGEVIFYGTDCSSVVRHSVVTGECQRTQFTLRPVLYCGFSPSGNRVVFATTTAIYTLSLDTWEKRLIVNLAEDDKVAKIAWSSCENHLLVQMRSSVAAKHLYWVPLAGAYTNALLRGPSSRLLHLRSFSTPLLGFSLFERTLLIWFKDEMTVFLLDISEELLAISSHVSTTHSHPEYCLVASSSQAVVLSQHGEVKQFDLMKDYDAPIKRELFSSSFMEPNSQWSKLSKENFL